MSRAVPTVFALLLLAAAAPHRALAYAESCSGGSCTQTFSLAAGWNAVWLEVQPEIDDSESVFDGLPLQSAWTWNPRGSVEFIQNPNEQELRSTDFLGYFPPSRPESFVNNMHFVKSHRPYLLRLSAPATWTVTGRPAVKPIRWIPGSFNLVGMPVDPLAPGSFAAYFAGSAAHAGQPVYRLTPDGVWQPLGGGELMASGEAFWIWTEGSSTYQGPFVVRPPFNQGLEFGSANDRLRLTIRSATGGALGVSLEPGAAAPVLTYRRSETPAAGGLDESWAALPSPLSVSLPAEPSWFVELGLRRAAVTSPFAAVLTVRGAGGRQWLPMSAEPGAGPASTEPDPSDPTGLWVGTVLVERVAELHHPDAPCQPDPVTGDPPAVCTPPPGYAPCGCGVDPPPDECSCVCGEAADGSCNPCSSAMPLRILVHVDGAGQARLLKEVVEACDRSTGGPEDPCAVLSTDAVRVAGLEGIARRGGDVVPVRLSSSSYDWDSGLSDATGGLAMTPAGGFGPGQTLNATLALAGDHPTNPYRHAFHRDHGGTCGCAASDTGCLARCADRFVFPLTRALEMVFDASDPYDESGGTGPLQTLSWGTRRLSGCYAETITGLHRLPVSVRGTFRLNRVSTVGSLR